jgi:HAMP domain-containing protein/GAF domain-containing protein
LFNTEAVPLAKQMDTSLSDLVHNQQNTLTKELSSGRRSLEIANLYIIGSGFVALLFGLLMAYLSRRAIAQPISRLTNVAEQIREGALDTQAKVESHDEIGVLASTFNNMTAKLRDTLFQVRKEKKRADDLLEVVIPIGVELSTEKDFNRLMEKMLLEAKSFCHADTGILYMLTPSGGDLDFVIVRSDSLHLAQGGATGGVLDYASLPMKVDGEPNQGNLVSRVALNGETINFNEFSQSGHYLWGDDEKNKIWRDYSVNSLLAIPLKSSAEKVLGVLQLINAQDADTSRIISFDPNLQQMMESFSSLAVAALEAFAREQKLKQEIQQLRIEIDQSKREKQVSDIVDTDFFKDLTTRAKEMRKRVSGTDS